jgi:nucleotide-binding universal stress UspA family protein
VGVDGSEHAERALDWAIRQARLTSARVRLVTAWHVPSLLYGAVAYVPSVEAPIDDTFRETAEQIAAAASERARDAGVEVEAVVGQGQPADLLIEAAEHAALLVVGSRGHGGFVGLLLGSVSAQLAHHAPCPLVIVR